jgi:hypothetical protein
VKVLFPSRPDASAQTRETWIDKVGSWKYNCLLLADFDPMKADSLYWNCTVRQIYDALISKKAYSHHEQ